MLHSKLNNPELEPQSDLSESEDMGYSKGGEHSDDMITEAYVRDK
jgi:hypothetical protein